MIRRLVCSALQPLNCSVLEAGTGAEAIKIFEQHHQRIALLLTDVVMPGMHGDDLAVHLLKAQPSLPVVFITAYCSQIQPAVRHCVCLQKPFRSEDICGVVGEFLESLEA
jgi:CheY-like chemotaxis protein